MVLRLTHKFAEMIDGVDLHAYREGDTVAFDSHDAMLLMAEGWAETAPERRQSSAPESRAIAHDRSKEADRGADGKLIRRGSRSKARLARPKGAT